MKAHPLHLASLVAFLGVSAATVTTCTSRGESPPPETSAGRVRPAVHAGSWYPGDPAALRREIDGRLQRHAGGTQTPPIIGLVGPHAGLRYSGEVAAAAYEPLKHQAIDRVFLLGPSHRTRFQGLALPAADLRAYGTPLGELVIDEAVIQALRGLPGFGGPDHAHGQEHSLEMHAIFLAAVKPGVRLVPLVVGNLGDAENVRAIAERLAPLIGPRDVVIASSDFTHYGPSFDYVPFKDTLPTKLDGLMNRALAPLAAVDLNGIDAYLAATGDTICGREPIRLLLALLPGDSPGREIARDTSGHQTGDYRNSVSYLSVLFQHAGGWPVQAAALQPGPTVLNPGEQRLALEMARKTLEVYLSEKRLPEDAELAVPAKGPFRAEYGTFVTLERDGNLRGCIGHIFAVQPLWRDIRNNAVAAAVNDPRFRPVGAAELPLLEIEISVLTHPKPVASYEEVIIGRHGVVLAAKGKRATFLPQVAADQHWDRATTLTRLARKAGLPGDVWRTAEVSLSVYEAQVFAEHGSH